MVFVVTLSSYSTLWFFFDTVKLNANRVVVGTLRGFDQFMNLVVDNTVEVNGNEKNDIGMVVSIHIEKLKNKKILFPLLSSLGIYG